MGLAHELVDLRVRGQMDDEIGRRVLDAVDAAGEGRVMAGEVLEQVRELVRPRVLPLVDAEDLVAVPQQAQREVRADLARRPRDEDPHAPLPRSARCIAREGYSDVRNPRGCHPRGVGYDQ